MKRADHHLIQQVLDGDVSREAFDAFQQRLRDEPELFKSYENYALLHHSLSEEFEGGHSDMAGAAEPSRRAFGIRWLLALAAVLALIVAAWQFVGRQAAKDVAVLTFSVDAVWRLDGSSRNLGAATGVAENCRLHLLQGRAGVSLAPAVTAVIEGPAELVFLSPESLHIEQGRGYFHRGGTGGALTVTTPRLTAVDSGTEFGIEVPPDGPDVLQVMDGNVRIVSTSVNEPMQLVAGDAVRVPAAGPIERITADGRPFPKGLGRFIPVLTGPFEKSEWRIGYGNPSVTGSRIEGENFSVFRQLSLPESDASNTVLLATLDVGKPARSGFHSDGWAGMSFFSGGEEVLFFGDSFGTRSTWSLDVKQRIPVILPEQPVVGPRMVTLRYDPRSADVTLHDGGVPLKAPFCSGKIPPGLRFDEIRLGASFGAGLAVKSLEIRVRED